MSEYGDYVNSLRGPAAGIRLAGIFENAPAAANSDEIFGRLGGR